MIKDKFQKDSSWQAQDSVKISPPLPLFRELSSAEKFPLLALGKVLSEAASAIKEIIQAPDALIGQSLLGAAALAVQGHADISIDGRNFPLSLFLLTVGVSGERKSGVDSVALFEHRQVEKEKIAYYEREIKNFDLEKEAHDSIKRKILNNSKLSHSQMTFELKKIGMPPLPPWSEIMLMEEPTYEGIVKAFVNGRPSVGLFSDEGGRMVGGHSMNQENQLKTVAGLCGLWDGKAISRTRAGDGSSKIYGKRMSLHLMLQPRVAELLTSNAMLADQGFLSRCLIAAPESTVGDREYNRNDLESDVRIVRYRKVMRNLLEHPLDLVSGTNQLNVRMLPISDSGVLRWIEFHDNIEKRMREGNDLSQIKGFACKAAEQALRIAGVLALAENVETKMIKTEYIESGIELVNFYLSEAIRLHSTAIINPELFLAQKLLTWSQKYLEIHLVQIYKFGPNAIREKATARRLITILEAHNWLHKIPGGKTIDGIKRNDVWEVVHE